ncbi:MAG TPA: TadE family protein [Mycobacteriales bacterium]|nr:TadE family protein [Mycobacteriales bacterium]
MKRGRRLTDSGAAVVEFLLVSIVLIALLLGVVQVGLYLHVRNIVAASAAEGARFAANADVADPVAGGPVAENIIAGALSRRVADGMQCTGRYEPGDAGTELVAVRCTGRVPLIFSWLGSLPGLDVTAHALKER